MSRTRSLILAALFAALTVVGAFLRIPTPVSSFTLQVMFTAMAGVLLGSRWGAASQAVYVLLGLLGLPVFTFGGGLGAALQPTFGFLLGMIPMAWMCGWITERRGAGFWTICLACLAGFAVLYAVGLPYMHAIVTVHLRRSWSVGQTVWNGMVLFLPWDALKMALTAALCSRIKPRLGR